MDILSLVIKANTAELDAAEKKLGRVGNAANKTEDSVDGLGKSLDGLKSVGGPLADVADRLEDMRGRAAGAVQVFGGLATSAVAVSAAMFTLIGAAGVVSALSFAGVLDDIGDMATKFGLSATQASLLDQQMKASGTSIDTYFNSLQKVANALAKSDDEGSKAAESLKTLGIATKEASTPQEVLNSLVEKYAEKIRTGNVSVQEQASLQSVLGKNYREVVVAAEAAATAQERLNSFQAAGVGISQDGLQAAGDLEAANNDLAFVLKAVGSELVAKVVPAFTSLINQLVESYKNGGLVKVAFDGIIFAANAVMIPIRGLVQIFIGLDTAVTTVGKSLGALFAAIETRSTQPFRQLASDIDTLWLSAAKKLEQAKLWGTDSGQVAGPTNMDTPPSTVGTGGKAGKAPKAGKDEAYEQAMRDARARSDARKKEYDEINKYLVDQALKEQEAARRRSENINREIAGYQMRVAWVAKDNEINRIANQLFLDRSKTQDDLNIAIAEFNVKEAERALNTAMNNGADAETLRLLQARLETQQQLLGLSQERKGDNENAQAAEKNLTFMDGMKNGYAELNKMMLSSAQMGEKAFVSMADKSSDAFADFVTTGKLNFKSFAASFLADIAKMIAKQMMLNALKSMMGGFFADGGAFSGGTQFFATGGVVTRPTAFNMSGGRKGVMGEAGPEAIMPLTRGKDGKLGVIAQGGGGQTVVNNNISVSIGSVDSEETKTELLREIKKLVESTSKQTIAQEMRQGGMLSRRAA